jgi:hypothetical protein
VDARCGKKKAVELLADELEGQVGEREGGRNEEDERDEATGMTCVPI